MKPENRGEDREKWKFEERGQENTRQHFLAELELEEHEKRKRKKRKKGQGNYPSGVYFTIIWSHYA